MTTQPDPPDTPTEAQRLGAGALILLIAVGFAAFVVSAIAQAFRQ